MANCDNQEIESQLACARSLIREAVDEIKEARKHTGNGAHKHLSEVILSLYALHSDIAPNNSHLVG